MPLHLLKSIVFAITKFIPGTPSKHLLGEATTALNLILLAFISKAPKNIVDQEKNNYNNLKIDVERISITIKGM